MPQFKMSVTGLTPDDVVDGILMLAERFQADPSASVAVDVSALGASTAGAAAPAPRTRQRKAAASGAAGPVEPVSPAAHTEAAGGLPDLGVGAANAAASPPVVGVELGTAGPVAAGPEGQGTEVTAPAASAGSEAAAGPGTEARGQGAETLPDLAALGAAPDPVDQAGRPPATLEHVQGLAKALGAKAGIGAVQAVFKEHGVQTPADIDPAKLIVLTASFDLALAS